MSRRGSGMRHVICPGSDQRGQKWFGHVQKSTNEEVRGLTLRMELPGEVDLRLESSPYLVTRWTELERTGSLLV